jgi:hypothetical protein
MPNAAHTVANTSTRFIAIRKRRGCVEEILRDEISNNFRSARSQSFSSSLMKFSLEIDTQVVQMQIIAFDNGRDEIETAISHGPAENALLDRKCSSWKYCFMKSRTIVAMLAW